MNINIPDTSRSALGTVRRAVAQAVCVTAAVSALYLVPVAFTAVQLPVFNSSVQAAEEEGRRPPPETRQSETLSRQVYERINEVMELRDMENYAGARAILDELRDLDSRGRLNNREKYTMWLFYASLDQAEENYRGALGYYEQILSLDTLAPDVVEQTWYYVGSLRYVLEEFREAIDAFEMYNEVAVEPNDDVYLRIATAYYQLEEYQNSIGPLQRYMEIRRAANEEIPQSSYSLLRALYLNLEDYPNAYQVLREMVVLFNDPADWGLLAAIAGQMEKFTEQAHTYYVANAGGFLDSESEFVNLASQLYNNDNPYGCAKIISKGMDDGVIEQDESNLSFLATCYQLAREDAKAAPFLERAAEMSDDGELYARLARVYMTMGDFEKSLEAFDNAFEKGGLDRPDQIYLTQARAFMEVNRYDEAIEAARKAARDERSADSAQTWITVLGSEKERYETLQRQRRELADYFR